MTVHRNQQNSREQGAGEEPTPLGVSSGLVLLVVALVAAFTLFLFSRAAVVESELPDTQGKPKALVVARPILSLDRMTHDFGTLSQFAKRDTFFMISNTGNAPLVLGSIHTGCHCIETSIARSTIQAGQQVILNVSLEAGLNLGTFEYDLVVPSNDPNNPEIHIDLRTLVVAPIQVTPTPIQFGRLKRGESNTLEVKLKSRTGAAFKILKIESSRDEITVLESQPDESRKIYSVQLAARPRAGSELAANVIMATLTITTDIDHGSPTQVQAVVVVE